MCFHSCIYVFMCFHLCMFQNLWTDEEAFRKVACNETALGEIFNLDENVDDLTNVRNIFCGTNLTGLANLAFREFGVDRLYAKVSII